MSVPSIAVTVCTTFLISSYISMSKYGAAASSFVLFSPYGASLRLANDLVAMQSQYSPGRIWSSETSRYTLARNAIASTFHQMLTNSCLAETQFALPLNQSIEPHHKRGKTWVSERGRGTSVTESAPIPPACTPNVESRSSVSQGS